MGIGIGIAQTAGSGLRRLADDGLAFAGRHAAPRVVDAMTPHLVRAAVPRIVDGILPHLERTIVPKLVDASIPILRGKVLPILIEDLTDNPLLRELLLEQSRGVVGQATKQLRNATARADDRAERFFHRLVHRDSER